MTAQEAYTEIWRYFSRPGAELAKTPTAQCQYRTAGGRKCAVGCLIPDELYDPSLEGEGLPTILAALRSTDLVADSDSPVFAYPLDKRGALLELLNGEGEENERKRRFLVTAQLLHDTRAKDAEDFVRLLAAAALGAGLIA